MRRLVTFLVVTFVTATAALWWLHDGDIAEGVKPVMVEWDAESLARNAGIGEAPTEGARP
ncbi:MAG: hypothetical protein H6736_21025 [Alphaproteobacteria bacterium]|nr:hypothetical protein [Alphaproteobacteria bacterium]MCB9694301.1 hypothetical protein [Alphaproteobacteria bacterium]